MKILHSIFSIDPQMGGPSKACIEMCMALAARGHEITIVSTDFFKSADHLPSWEIQAQKFPKNLTWKKAPVTVLTSGFVFSLPLAKLLKKTISESDVVHVHSLYLFHSLVAGHFARKQNKPYIIRPHGTLDPFLFKRKRWLKWPVETLFQNHNLKTANAIHFTTEEEMLLAKPHIFGAPGVVVPNGLHPEEYENLPPKGSFRNKYPETVGKKLILFFSRINFKKGLDILTPAFIKLAQKHNDYHLALVGPDDSGLVPRIITQLQQAGLPTEGLQSRITISGMISGDDKLAALKDADIFVLPSYSENFGIAVIEAMICGLPVVISDKVNIWREVVADGAGVVGSCDINWFADTIESLLEQPEKRHEMGLAGIASVKKRYDWKNIAVQLEQTYENVIEQHRLKKICI